MEGRDRRRMEEGRKRELFLIFFVHNGGNMATEGLGCQCEELWVYTRGNRESARASGGEVSVRLIGWGETRREGIRDLGLRY